MANRRRIIRALRPEMADQRALFFDGVNDDATRNSATADNFGTGDFTFISRFAVFSPASRYQALVMKADLINTSTNSIGLQVDLSKIRFLIEFQKHGASNKLEITGGNIVACTEYCVAVLRKGGDAAGNLINSNYEIWLQDPADGLMKKQTVIYTGSLISPNVDSDGPLGLSFLAYTKANYRKVTGIWSVALTQDELNKAAQGTYTSRGVRGVYEFRETSGKLLKDTSSSLNHATLAGYTDLETGIPDPLTNEVWAPYVLLYPGVGDKTFYVPKSGIIRQIIKRNSSTNSGYTLNGTFYPIAYDGSGKAKNLNISVNKDEQLIFNSSAASSIEIYM